MKVTFLSKDNNWQDVTTTYWFSINGYHTGTDQEFENDEFRIVHDGMNVYAVDYSGYVIQNEWLLDIVMKKCVVTDEMIAM